MSKRITIELALLIGLLAAVVAWSYGRMADQRAAAGAAQADLGACRNMAARFKGLDRRSELPTDPARFEAEATGRIERAAKNAGVAAGPELIDPEPARRVADTPYKAKPTLVLLRDVTLGQLVRFVHPLIADGLHADFIRLSAPRADDTTDTWSAEVTFTYLYYDPPNQPRPRP